MLCAGGGGVFDPPKRRGGLVWERGWPVQRG